MCKEGCALPLICPCFCYISMQLEVLCISTFFCAHGLAHFLEHHRLLHAEVLLCYFLFTAIRPVCEQTDLSAPIHHLHLQLLQSHGVLHKLKLFYTHALSSKLYFGLATAIWLFPFLILPVKQLPDDDPILCAGLPSVAFSSDSFPPPDKLPHSDEPPCAAGLNFDISRNTSQHLWNQNGFSTSSLGCVTVMGVSIEMARQMLSSSLCPLLRMSTIF